jgi:protein SCO1/2
LRPVLDAYGVTATRRVADARRYKNLPRGMDAPYSIDHTAGFIVVGKGGRLRLHFPHETPAEQMAPAVLRLLEEATP